MNVKAEIKKYWDKRSSSYDRSPGHVSIPEVWRSILNDVFDSHSEILDVGTGTGFLASILVELGHKVTGLDLSERMLRVAIEKAGNAEFVLGDAENLPFKDDSFDAVICRHLLWTLPNPELVVSEWVRVAREKVVIVDGRWMINSKSAKIRKFLGRVVAGVYERRNPLRNFHYRNDINKLLPFYGGASADSVMELCKSLGLKAELKDLSWLRNLQKQNLPLAYRLQATSVEYYMVEIEK